ncbi:MAG TPA: glycosyl hydrolase, partial [Gammaproteobacteria bacterium]|nr:glycosyl hydrolase [Gammaproteobacteria bacterium]
YVVVDNQEQLPEDQWDMGDTAINAKRLKKMTTEELLLQDKDALEKFLRDNNFPPETTADKVIEKLKEKKTSPQDLVKSLKNANNNLFDTDIKGLEVYRSDDGGDTFSKTHEKPLDNVVFTYGYYFGKIHVDPNDANTIYTMGVPLIKSTDGGQNWTSLYDPKVHVDYHEVWIDPKNSNHIIAANDGGADESYDGGEHWRKLDYQPVGQFYTVNVDMEEPYNVYGGLQDNGTLKGSSKTDWKDGESWTRLFGGDGMYVSTDDKTTYVGFQFGNYFKLGEGKPKSIKPPNYLNESPLRYNWNTPVVLSPHNKEIIYYGANKLYRSMDKGETYKAISKDLTQSLKYGDVPYATITSISESPLEFGRIIVGTDDGLVWVTSDGGNNWKNVTKKLPQKLWVSRVVASEHDKNQLWLTLNNYRNDDIQSYVYYSTNFGKSWKDISNNLPNSAVNVIKEDPKTKGLVYAGTDRGVYYSLNYGQKWQTLGDEFPTV